MNTFLQVTQMRCLSATAPVKKVRGVGTQISGRMLSVFLLQTPPLRAQMVAVREALRLAMEEEMRKDDKIILLGEEVAQYKGAYKVGRPTHVHNLR